MAEQVDIYADLNTEEDGDALQNEADALYDDVLTGSVDTKTSLENPSNESEGEPMPVKISRSGRNVSGPYSVYVGHFSWWTSDRDLIAMAKTLGVKDVLEVKFAEFKVNGQSRGFAKMVVSTEDSLKRLLHSMSQCEIDGEKLECRIASRSHLEMFENQANKRYPQRSDSKAEPARDEGKSSSVPKKPEITLPLPIPYPPVKPPPVMPSFFGARPPFYNAPPPMFPHPPPHAQFNPHLPKPYLPNTHIPHPHLPNTHTPIPHMHTHPHPPALHINPAFFSSAHATHSSSSTYGQQRDVDSEELINRNRLVASNAINKAMSGATSETIETLLTAIAVIRQSQVYTDERCQTLVESLKDCLYSVESKSCSSRRRHRSRDRARSREKERYRDRSSSTDRERERERERERGRDREHRDRY